MILLNYFKSNFDYRINLTKYLSSQLMLIVSEILYNNKNQGLLSTSSMEHSLILTLFNSLTKLISSKNKVWVYLYSEKLMNASW